ncbi:hypothetical protein V8G69_07875 [Gaetbulibacter sp. M235]|uniref:hypothetical protein n=1 Tax=Gaetbulibacter sp. M235 TaxID=3126510 RepID=UPI00374F8AF4
MKTLVKLLIIALMPILSSCGVKRVYTTASYESLKSYTEKAHYNNEKSSSFYVAGDINFGKHEQESENFNDKTTLATFSIYQSITDKHYNFYYGLGSGFGTYRFTKGFENLIEDKEKKNFYNLNFKTGINYTMPRRVIDYRFIGLEIAYHNEFGPYQNKLSDLLKSNNSELLIVNDKSLLSFNLYSEYVFKFSEKDAFTIGFYFGDLINHKKVEAYDYSTGFSGITTSLRLNKYSISFVTESVQGKTRSSKIGLTYKL